MYDIDRYLSDLLDRTKDSKLRCNDCVNVLSVKVAPDLCSIETNEDESHGRVVMNRTLYELQRQS